MSDLTLHFEVPPGIDMTAAAAELQKSIVEINGVASAQTKPQRFQAISAQEILSVVKFATSIAENTAALLTAIAAVQAAWQKAKLIFPGLRPPTVEVGLKKVPLDQVTPEHLAEIASSESDK